MIILFLFAVTFAVYANIINNSIVVDDIKWIKGRRNPSTEKKSLLTRLRFRLYGIGTLWNRKWKDETNIKIDHILSIFLHAVTVSLIYIVFGQNSISFAAAILYAVNPINNQTAIWSNGRRYAIANIIVLLMFYLGPKGIVLYPLTFILHATAAMAPVLYGWWGFLVPVAGAIAMRKIIKEKIRVRLLAIHSKELRTFYLKKLIPMVKIYGLYFSRLIFPGIVRMSYTDMYYFGVTKEGTDDAFEPNSVLLLGVFCIAISIVVLATLTGQMFFMWLFLILSIAQWCPAAFVYVQGLADRYVCASSMFMMFFVAKFIYSFFPTMAPTLVACLFIYYVSMLVIAFKMYKNIDYFYNYHIFADIESPGIRALNANRFILMGKPMEAWGIISQGLRFAPNDFRLNMAAAECCYMFKDAVGVKFFIDKCEQNYYMGQKHVLEPRIKRMKDKCGITKFEEEVELIKQGKSKLPAVERKRVMVAAGIEDNAKV